MIKFKTDKVHKAQATPDGIYYRCNHAVGRLYPEQLLQKTNWRGNKKITCKNCIRRRYER